MIAIFLLLVLLIIYFLVCFICGIVQYIKTPRPPNRGTWQDYYNYYHDKEWQLEQEEQEEQEETPFYILDKLAAYDNQIESYNAMLELLNVEYNNTTDNMKRAAIRKKQADLMLKLATIEEKAHKLRETLE